MSLSILQKIQVFFLVGIIKVIYLADSSLAVLLERVSVVTGRIAIIFISVAFLFFIGFSIKTQYLSNVFQGFIASQTSSPKLNYNSLNVLGASAVKPDTPILVSENPFPEVTSRAILVIDKSNNKTLYEKIVKLVWLPRRLLS